MRTVHPASAADTADRRYALPERHQAPESWQRKRPDLPHLSAEVAADTEHSREDRAGQADAATPGDVLRMDGVAEHGRLSSARYRHLLIVLAVVLPQKVVVVAEVGVPQLSRRPFGIEDHVAT